MLVARADDGFLLQARDEPVADDGVLCADLARHRAIDQGAHVLDEAAGPSEAGIALHLLDHLLVEALLFGHTTPSRAFEHAIGFLC